MRGGEFAELKAFVAVVDRASFARAAEHLGLSPSALSQTIRNLEKRLGLPLLTRTTRSVAPTEAGQKLLGTVAPRFEGACICGGPAVEGRRTVLPARHLVWIIVIGTAGKLRIC